MKPFIHDHFLLQTETAKQLYHDYCADLPIIDYHSHLDPKTIADNQHFKSITDIWLNGDHYKWRALRANGTEEKYITGSSTDEEKFEKWAACLPNTLRNPLFHWSALELKRYFQIENLLNKSNADEVYKQCNEKLMKDEFKPQSLLKKMKVEVVCSTDNPLDDLADHKRLASSNIKVLPTFRPDGFIDIDKPNVFVEYLNKASEITGIEIHSFKNLVEIIEVRINYFHEVGCRLSDHGLDDFFGDDYTSQDIEVILSKAIKGEPISFDEVRKYKSAILHELACLYHKKGWVQQFHVGAIRNNNTRMEDTIGKDTGYDSMGDSVSVANMSKFLNKLDKKDKLTKTILYNLNPADNAKFATMAGNFNQAPYKGKIQYGAAWWFLDQKNGIEKQLDDLSDFGLLAHFVGMLTDSRSFMSFPRHEYFRRVLCNIIGKEVEEGLIPNDQELLKRFLQNICYYNAKNFFGF